MLALACHSWSCNPSVETTHVLKEKFLKKMKCKDRLLILYVPEYMYKVGVMVSYECEGETTLLM